MPTIKNLFENDGDGVTDIGKIIARYPYRDYGLDESGDSVMVTFPNGMKIRVLNSTLQYYFDVMGEGLEQKDQYGDIIKKVDSIIKGGDLAKRTIELKSVSRDLAGIEYNSDAYSFVSYLINLKYVDKEQLVRLHKAFVFDNSGSLDGKDREIYEKALVYSCYYYRFLLGLFSIL